MMRFSILVLVAGIGWSLTSGTPSSGGQCIGASGAVFTNYGTTCPFFGQDAFLFGGYDATTCTLTLELTAATTCCNTFLSQQLYLFGTLPADAALPELVSGCRLSVIPLLILPQPGGGKVSFQVPPVAALTTVYFQGVNDYFTTIGFTHDYQSSNGLRVDLF